MDEKQQKRIMRQHMKERLGVVMNFTDNPPLPKSLNIELNNTCNQKCVFCPYHGKYAINELKPAVLKEDFVKKLLIEAHKLEIGEKEVGFYIAGEPLAYKSIDKIIKFTKDLGYKYTFITTNGGLATKERIDAILEAGIDSIRFSVNAADRETYREIHQRDDFEKVVENIKYLDYKRKKESINVAVSLSCVVTKKNKDSIEKVKNIFAPYVDDILFIPIIFTALKDLDNIKKEYQIVEDTDEINKDYICPVLFDTMYINAFGKVVPCCDAYHGNVEFADLNDEIDLVEAWNSEGYRKYRDIFYRGLSDDNTICKTCVLRRKGVDRLSIDGF